MKALVLVEGEHYDTIYLAIAKNNTEILSDYVEDFDPPSSYVINQDIGQIFICLDCIISSSPYEDRAIRWSINNVDFMVLGLS